MVPSVFGKSCISEGLIICLELFIHDQAPRMACRSPAFFEVLFSHLSSVQQQVGHLLNVSDQLRQKFLLHRPFEDGCQPPQEFPWLFIQLQTRYMPKQRNPCRLQCISMHSILSVQPSVQVTINSSLRMRTALQSNFSINSRDSTNHLHWNPRHQDMG